jgi:regulatory protein
VMRETETQRGLGEAETLGAMPGADTQRAMPEADTQRAMPDADTHHAMPGAETPRAMRVTGLHSQRRHAGRANLHVDGAFHCGVAWEVVHERGLRAGMEVDERVLEELRLDDERWKAKDAALTLLATRVRSRRELADRLRRKRFPQAAVDYALQEVQRLGLLDDRAFAEAWVRDRLRLRPRGSRALLAELARRGVDGEAARSAVAAVMREEGTDDAALCAAAAEKWLRSQQRQRPATADPDERRRIGQRRERRLAAFLARRGFGTAAIRDAVRTAVGKAL